MRALALVLAALVTGCGGGGGSIHAEAPISSAQAQVAQKVEVAHLFGILRPGSDGAWYIQGSASNPDPDHKPWGIASVSKDQSDHLEVCLDRKYTFAGSISVQEDWDFRKAGVHGTGDGLSHECFEVYLEVRGVKISPRDILNYITPGEGNFWLMADMQMGGQ